MAVTQTRIITVTIEDLELLMTTVIKKELESILSNPPIGYDFNDELWDRKKAAEFLGISQQTLIKLVLEEKLVAQKSGRKYHFLKSSMMNFLRNVSKTINKWVYHFLWQDQSRKLVASESRFLLTAYVYFFTQVEVLKLVNGIRRSVL